jgi:hypothetical protein
MPLYIGTTNSTGKNLFASLERLSDGFFWNASTDAWASNPAAADRKVPLTEGTGPNAGSYSTSVTGLGDAGWVFVRLHDDDDPADATYAGGHEYVLQGEEAEEPAPASGRPALVFRAY